MILLHWKSKEDTSILTILIKGQCIFVNCTEIKFWIDEMYRLEIWEKCLDTDVLETTQYINYPYPLRLTPKAK